MRMRGKEMGRHVARLTYPSHIATIWNAQATERGEKEEGCTKGRGKNGLFKLLGSHHSAKDSQESLLFGCLFVYLFVFKVDNHSKSIITQSSAALEKIAPPPRPL